MKLQASWITEGKEGRVAWGGAHKMLLTLPSACGWHWHPLAAHRDSVAGMQFHSFGQLAGSPSPSPRLRHRLSCNLICSSASWRVRHVAMTTSIVNICRTQIKHKHKEVSGRGRVKKRDRAWRERDRAREMASSRGGTFWHSHVAVSTAALCLSFLPKIVWQAMMKMYALMSGMKKMMMKMMKGWSS